MKELEKKYLQCKLLVYKQYHITIMNKDTQRFRVRVRVINACRFYFNVIYLSDITKPNVIDIDNKYLIGIKTEY